MKLLGLLVPLVALSLPLSAHAQLRASNQGEDYGRWNAQTSAAPKSWLPFTSYGYVGAGLGQSVHDNDSCAPGFSCDRRNLGGKVFVGGMFSRIFGAEVAYVNVGEVDRNGGDATAHGINLSAVANLPVTSQLGIFAKVGTIYGRTRTDATAPGVRSGHEQGFNWSYGAGAQFELNRNWALRADWDRYRFDYEDRRDDVDLYSVNVLYKF